MISVGFKRVSKKRPAYTGLALNYVAVATTTSNHQEFTDKALATANNSQAHINYSTVLSIQGKHEQALQESRIGFRLYPASGDVITTIFCIYITRAVTTRHYR